MRMKRRKKKFKKLPEIFVISLGLEMLRFNNNINMTQNITAEQII